MSSKFTIKQEGKKEETLYLVTTDLNLSGSAMFANCTLRYKYSDGTSHIQNLDTSLEGKDQIELKNGLQVTITVIEGNVSFNNNGMLSECCNIKWTFSAYGDYIDRPQDIENGTVVFFGNGDLMITAYGDTCS